MKRKKGWLLYSSFHPSFTHYSCRRAPFFVFFKFVLSHYNHVKNGITCKGTHKRDYYELQGESYIMEVEGLIYSEFMKTVQQNEDKSIRSKSENECIKLAAYVKLSKHMDGTWHKNEIRENINEFLQALNVNVNTILPNGLLACESESGA